MPEASVINDHGQIIFHIHEFTNADFENFLHYAYLTANFEEIVWITFDEFVKNMQYLQSEKIKQIKLGRLALGDIVCSTKDADMVLKRIINKEHVL
jgi:hypothetical protein